MQSFKLSAFETPVALLKGGKRLQACCKDNCDTLNYWLRQAGRIPLLTASEEVHLGTLVRSWQDWEEGPDNAPNHVSKSGQRAKRRMISASLRLIATITKKYLTRASIKGIPYEDLLQEATLGANRGCEKFDPSKEGLENPSSPRENTRVIAGTDWAHGQQAARIQ